MNRTRRTQRPWNILNVSTAAILLIMVRWLALPDITGLKIGVHTGFLGGGCQRSANIAAEDGSMTIVLTKYRFDFLREVYGNQNKH